MPLGGGKYDEHTDQILRRYRASVVIVAVIGGIKGPGFSVSTTDMKILAAMPALLRDMADQIEKDTK